MIDFSVGLTEEGFDPIPHRAHVSGLVFFDQDVIDQPDQTLRILSRQPVKGFRLDLDFIGQLLERPLTDLEGLIQKGQLTRAALGDGKRHLFARPAVVLDSPRLIRNLVL